MTLSGHIALLAFDTVFFLWLYGLVRRVTRPPMQLRASGQRPYYPKAYLCPEPDCRRALFRPRPDADVFACRSAGGERHPHTWGALELVSYYEAERAHEDLEPRLAAARLARPRPDRLKRRRRA